MKHIKLFENWLNEAESTAKAFDPKKPYNTLVVDITKEQLFADETKTARVIDSL